MKKNTKKYIQETLNDTSPDVLDQIKSSHRFNIPKKPKKQSIFDSFPKRLVFSLSTIVIVFVLMLAIIRRNTEPVVASTVTLDINPSIEITLDDEDDVINITSVNDEGEEIINHDILRRGVSLDRVIEFIIQKAHERGYIIEEATGENVVLISISATNETIRTRLNNRLNNLLNQEIKRYGPAPHIIHNQAPFTPEQIEQFRSIAGRNRMTLARIVLIEHILELDTTSTYTLENLKPLPIRELYRIRETLLGNPDPFMPMHDDPPMHDNSQ